MHGSYRQGFTASIYFWLEFIFAAAADDGPMRFQIPPVPLLIPCFLLARCCVGESCLIAPDNAFSSAVTIEITDAQLSLIQNTLLASPIAGVVAKVFVAEGDVVEVGYRVVQLDDRQVRTEHEAAADAMEAARMDAENDVDVAGPARV